MQQYSYFGFCVLRDFGLQEKLILKLFFHIWYPWLSDSNALNFGFDFHGSLSQCSSKCLHIKGFVSKCARDIMHKFSFLNDFLND